MIIYMYKEVAQFPPTITLIYIQVYVYVHD